MDGHVQLKEVGELTGQVPMRMRQLMQRGVFEAVKHQTLWWVPAERIPSVIYRINQYLARKPFDPLTNVTVKDAAEALGCTLSAVYGMIVLGSLTEAEGELWKCVTRESLDQMLARKGRRRTRV